MLVRNSQNLKYTKDNYEIYSKVHIRRFLLGGGYIWRLCRGYGAWWGKYISDKCSAYKEKKCLLGTYSVWSIKKI